MSLWARAGGLEMAKDCPSQPAACLKQHDQTDKAALVMIRYAHRASNSATQAMARTFAIDGLHDLFAYPIENVAGLGYWRSGGDGG